MAYWRVFNLEHLVYSCSKCHRPTRAFTRTRNGDICDDCYRDRMAETLTASIGIFHVNDQGEYFEIFSEVGYGLWKGSIWYDPNFVEYTLTKL